MSSATKQALEKICDDVHGTRGLTFPETVGALLEHSVTRYHVDFVACTNTYYIRKANSNLEDVHTVSIPELAQNLAPKFTKAGVAKAVERVQQGKSTYTEFADECARAGVVGYLAFLDGKNVAYYGAQGEWHVEWFPGAGPKAD